MTLNLTNLIILLPICFFPQLLHPLAIVITLILLTLYISIIISVLIQFSWLAYILFLVMLGGLLVLFIYVASLAPNRKILNVSIFSPRLLLLSYLIISPHSLKDSTLTNISNIINLKKLFFPIACNTTILLTLFLLFTLIAVVLISKFRSGPLRIYTYDTPHSEKPPAY